MNWEVAKLLFFWIMLNCNFKWSCIFPFSHLLIPFVDLPQIISNQIVLYKLLSVGCDEGNLKLIVSNQIEDVLNLCLSGGGFRVPQHYLAELIHITLKYMVFENFIQRVIISGCLWPLLIIPIILALVKFCQKTPESSQTLPPDNLTLLWNSSRMNHIITW